MEWLFLRLFQTHKTYQKPHEPCLVLPSCFSQFSSVFPSFSPFSSFLPSFPLAPPSQAFLLRHNNPGGYAQQRAAVSLGSSLFVSNPCPLRFLIGKLGLFLRYLSPATFLPDVSLVLNLSECLQVSAHTHTTKACWQVLLWGHEVYQVDPPFHFGHQQTWVSVSAFTTLWHPYINPQQTET